jgi:twitching motility protein PilT
LQLTDLLKYATERGASDLHIMAGMPPVIRVAGEIIVTEFNQLTPEDTKEMILACIPAEKHEILERDLQLCYSLKIPDVGYFRIAVYYEQGTFGASARIGMTRIKSLQELGLPETLADLVRRPSGLVLITGPTGSGKTTTLNSLIDLINRERRCKVIMVEDPIEYVHPNKRSIIVQQEVYTDTKSFGKALIHILRQDPDVIGVGEMRDLETISTALTAAETGHLVISTLHTPSAAKTVDRIIDVFPASQQPLVRAQLANSIEAVISQRLLPRVDMEGRILATEVMMANPAVRNLIREGKTEQLPNVISTGQASGMYSMDSSLKRLYQQGVITYDSAVSNARVPDDIRMLAGGEGAVAVNGHRGI